MKNLKRKILVKQTNRSIPVVSNVGGHSANIELLETDLLSPHRSKKIFKKSSEIGSNSVSGANESTIQKIGINFEIPKFIEIMLYLFTFFFKKNKSFFNLFMLISILVLALGGVFFNNRIRQFFENKSISAQKESQYKKELSSYYMFISPIIFNITEGMESTQHVYLGRADLSNDSNSTDNVKFDKYSAKITKISYKREKTSPINNSFNEEIISKNYPITHQNPQNNYELLNIFAMNIHCYICDISQDKVDTRTLNLLRNIDFNRQLLIMVWDAKFGHKLGKDVFQNAANFINLTLKFENEISNGIKPSEKDIAELCKKRFALAEGIQNFLGYN